ncbi:MAG: 2-oxoglutarate ferredoxin oxidoreductase subunit beta [Cyclobacteriaceae bacterium]|nr:MAG: 2-oxoglutarate ferredoxin oxidoreductase subunit beta [Cyclobacteriaceae bacterium]
METIEPPVVKTLTKKDFESDQLVRWCPGCGDYAILAAMTNALPQLNILRENFVFVSGIGCAARFPYYVNTYGFHTIHGRGPAFATGIKLANPQLSVWEIQGDGDALAIGGNHFIHALRRNIDINIILFNNEIYGLTKGQYSPTSPTGLVTKSTPYGTIERPFRAADLVIGAQGTFFARTIDTNPKLMTEIFVEAARHKGTSLVEVLQNCVIFNDDAHAAITARENRDDFQLHLKHGQPMLFGKDRKKGIRLNGLKLEVVTIGENGVTESDILVHDAHSEDPTLHLMLARMAPPHYPMALGVIRQVRAKTFDEAVAEEAERVKQVARYNSVDELLNSGETWEIK